MADGPLPTRDRVEAYFKELRTVRKPPGLRRGAAQVVHACPSDETAPSGSHLVSGVAPLRWSTPAPRTR
jgi:hypothetical protein